MHLAMSSASTRRSSGNRGTSSLNNISRASARSTGLLGRSCIGATASSVEQHQQLELALGGTPPGQREIEVTLAANYVPVGLLKGNRRPPRARQDFPKMDPAGVDRPAGFAFVAAVERSAPGDPAGLPVEPRKAPALAAKPADGLVRVASAGELPMVDSG